MKAYKEFSYYLNQIKIIYYEIKIKDYILI